MFQGIDHCLSMALERDTNICMMYTGMRRLGVGATLGGQPGHQGRRSTPEGGSVTSRSLPGDGSGLPQLSAEYLSAQQ